MTVYRAFISYSHSDKAVATWLHRSLEHYGFPKKLIGKTTSLGVVPKRLTPIFRDQDELPASGNLSSELKKALSLSEFLIVICSTASAKSKWVNEEVRQYKMMHGENRVLALVINGEPNARDLANECFPPALKQKVNDKGDITADVCEPIAADLRKQADGRKLAKLKLISGLTGLRLDDLVQREAARRIRFLAQVSIASLASAAFAIGLAVYANNQRLEAVEQRTIAENESATSTAVSDFLVSTFINAESLQQNPNEVTARSILDQGSKKITSELDGQPIIQSRLSTTIARAYNNLGLFDQAINVIDDTALQSGFEGASAFLVKAESFWKMGDLDASINTANYAIALTEKHASTENPSRNAKTRANVFRLQGLIHYQLGQHKKGIDAFNQALAEFELLNESDLIQIANTLQSRALLFSDMGEFESADDDLSRAKNLVIASEGKNDILYGRINLAQAQVSYLSGNMQPALEQIDGALSNMERILEVTNPALADAYSMKGQILHALGEFEQAQSALTLAVESYNKAYGGRHYLSGIAEVYLGLIAGDMADYQRALAHFDEAKLHYDEGYGGIHANHGDLMVNRATVLSAAGDTQRAIQECAQGMQILNDTLGEEAAFTKQLQAVCDDIKNSL